MRSLLNAWWLVVSSLLLAGCAAKDYPARDDHDHTPGPPLPAMSSMPEGG